MRFSSGRQNRRKRLAPLFISLVIVLARHCFADSASAPKLSAKQIAQLRNFALTHQGDAVRGKALFEDQQKLACSKCHVVNGQGGRVGPELSSAGDKFGRQELIEAIVSPSATIAVGYSTTVVKMRDGEVHEGIIKDDSAAGLLLMGADGQAMALPKDQIAQQRTTDKSLMPEGLYAGLKPAEFADLIAYLSSLKTQQTASVLHHGMPAEIPVLRQSIELTPINEGLRFQHPVWFSPVPGVAHGYAVIEHESGRIWLMDRSTSTPSRSLFLQAGKYMTGTRGLLGMTFHPDYAHNRRYFIVKHLSENGKFASIVFEGKAAPDLRKDSGEPLRPVLRLAAVTNVHYGGCLQFGPDHMLYIGMGDTGPQGDPEGHAQNLSLLLGKMLRIDVDHPEAGKAYSVPSDNPFVGRPNVRPEIWAYGLREPWRFSFDPVTGDLWVGDVGQDLYEEVDIVRKGENYGWNVYEGFEPYSNKYRREGEDFVQPIFAWTRKYGASSTGGFVYRGKQSPSFYGVYIFGDYQNSRIFALTQENRVLKKVRLLATAPEHVVSFGQDNDGELYAVGYEGTIYHIDLSRAKFE